MTSPRGDRRAAGPTPAAISLTLPDGQTVRVRLQARQEVAGPHPWRYLVGVPSWIARPNGVEAAEYNVWVTDRQLTPIEGVDLSGVPTRRLPGPPPQPASGWVLRPAPERRGRTVVHDAACRHASGGGTELGTQEAVDALMRDGFRACTDCDAAAVLVPALELGQGHG
ncbi:hypothetical protein SMIR_04660 [Streptomyces mirabilis]|uniref:DUF6233 domain-containing protein n=1 Tax=Streptomyces mirabilis TaxID=68239 RepID=UPI001BB05D1A|nr:DUF6233 domain-containing protein [Streptomyces mirabilis]QUW78512.1 hypothetical protein SMIR_04660 [Streptomyces mirabilis]